MVNFILFFKIFIFNKIKVTRINRKMVEILLKRDVFEKRRRHELLVGPEMMQNHLTLERYDATEDVLRMTRK